MLSAKTAVALPMIVLAATVGSVALAAKPDGPRAGPLPARTSLTGYSLSQKGVLLFARRVDASLDPEGRLICSAGEADGVDRFPDLRAVKRRRGVFVLRIRRKDRPRELSVAEWRSLDPDGSAPDLRPRQLETSLKRIRNNGKTVEWRVRFKLAGPGAHYITTFLKWRHPKCESVENLGRRYSVNLVDPKARSVLQVMPTVGFNEPIPALPPPHAP